LQIGENYQLPCTVLIPVRGDCEYINQTLLSIKNSQILPAEIILIDDGISSFTNESILNFKIETELKLIKNSGSGIVDALNTGIKFSTYEYIARIDADDLVMPDRFFRQIEYLDNNPNVVVVGSQVKYIDENSFNIGQSAYPVGRIENHHNFSKRCIIAHPTVMLRKSVLIKVGMYRSVCKIDSRDLAEDFDLWLRMASAGEIHIIDSILSAYRIHKRQISSQFGFYQQFATDYISLLNKKDGFRKLIFVNSHLNEPFKSIIYIIKLKSLKHLLAIAGDLFFIKIFAGTNQQNRILTKISNIILGVH
jgi:glycosyltransferase involved in cell wall biosynthesis